MNRANSKRPTNLRALTNLDAQYTEILRLRELVREAESMPSVVRSHLATSRVLDRKRCRSYSADGGF